MSTLFIADLHLQANRPALTHAFLDYLATRAQDADTLYIMGDLFEHWVGDDGMGPFEYQIADALQAYSNSKRRVFFMHGNRDFLVGEGFAKRANATLLDDPTVVTLGNERVLLMHGDSMCTQDPAYMQFRAQVRSPAWQQQVLAMPLEQRIALAAQLRAQSGEANSTKSADIMDVAEDAVVAEMNTANVCTLIQGHTHRPNEHTVDLGNGRTGRRLVLGDWREDEQAMWEAIYSDGTLSLQRYHW